MLPDQVKRERFDWCWAQSSQVLWQAMAAAKPSMSRANLSRGLDGNVCFSCCDSLASRGASAACSRSRGCGAAKSWSFGGHIRDQAGQPRCRWCRPWGGVNQGLKRGRESGDKWNQAESTDRLAGVARPCGNTEKICWWRLQISTVDFIHIFRIGLGLRQRRGGCGARGRGGLPSCPRVSSSLPRVEDEVAELNEPTVFCMFLVRQEQGI